MARGRSLRRPDETFRLNMQDGSADAGLVAHPVLKARLAM